MSEGKFFPGYDEEENYYDVLREQAKYKAKFCLATGISPSEYENLTRIEIEEFIKEVNRQSKKGA